MYVFTFALIMLLGAKETLASDKACRTMTLEEIYQKVVDENPVNKLIDQRIGETEGRLDIAKQRLNPEVNLDFLRSDEFGVARNTYSISAKHFIELGSKRAKRIEKEKISIELGIKELELRRSQNHLDIMANLQRLSQVDVVITATKEAIDTFDGIIKRLKSRSGLNPEERISLSTLQLATNDYLAKLNDLKNEKRNLEGELEFILDCRLKNVKYQKLNYKNAYAQFEEKGLGLKSIEENLPKLTQAELEVEKSLGYSDLGIGPTFEFQEQGRNEFYSAGVAVSFTLPLFHTNDGGKKVALKKHLAQKIESENNLKQIDIRLRNQIENYRNSLEYLNRMPSLEELEKKHQEVDQLFARGIVSIALSIEAHRQNIDFLDSRFETENDLFDALKEILLITGNKVILPSLIK